MDTFKELNNYTLLKADGKNYLYDLYIVNDSYAISNESVHGDWVLMEYDYATNIFGEVEYSTYSLESLLIYIKEFIK